MVTCPRCEHPVDETAVSVCPLCNTPIQPSGAPSAINQDIGFGRPFGVGAEAPGAPDATHQPTGMGQPYGGGTAAPGAPLLGSQAPGMPTPVSLRGASAPGVPGLNSGMAPTMPGTMRSLTGEIIETPVSAAPPAVGPGSYGGAPAVPRPNSTAPRRYEAAPAPSGGKGGLLGIVALLVLVLGAGGGWFWWTHRPGATPTDTVKRVLTAQANEDFKTVYNFMELPATAKAKYPDATAFDTGMKDQQKTLSNSPLGGLVTGMKDKLKTLLQTAKVGEAKTEGDTATVPITLNDSSLGINNLSVDIPLKNIGGIWKVDATSGKLGTMGMGLTQ